MGIAGLQGSGETGVQGTSKVGAQEEEFCQEVPG